MVEGQLPEIVDGRQNMGLRRFRDGSSNQPAHDSVRTQLRHICMEVIGD